MSRSGSNQKRRPQSKAARSTARTRSSIHNSPPTLDGRVVTPPKNIFPADSDASSELPDLDTTPEYVLGQPNLTDESQPNFEAQATQVRQDLTAKDDLVRLTRAPLPLPELYQRVQAGIVVWLVGS